jgi:hypothetical protein
MMLNKLALAAVVAFAAAGAALAGAQAEGGKTEGKEGTTIPAAGKEDPSKKGGKEAGTIEASATGTEGGEKPAHEGEKKAH